MATVPLQRQPASFQGDCCGAHRLSLWAKASFQPLHSHSWAASSSCHLHICQLSHSWVRVTGELGQGVGSGCGVQAWGPLRVQVGGMAQWPWPGPLLPHSCPTQSQGSRASFPAQGCLIHSFRFSKATLTQKPPGTGQGTHSKMMTFLPGRWQEGRERGAVAPHGPAPRAHT